MKLPKCETTSIPNVPLFEKTKEDHRQMSLRESPLRHSESAATYEHRVTLLYAYTTYTYMYKHTGIHFSALPVCEKGLGWVRQSLSSASGVSQPFSALR